jgi:hypothetical protein
MALCQRCQNRVKPDLLDERPDWIKPYIAGFYAWKYRGEDLGREEVEQRIDELLKMETRA